MGWRGTLRTIRSTANKIERESKRRERELEKRRKEHLKLQERELAILEVDEYENYIDRIKSIHKEVSDVINWNSVAKLKEPKKPIFDNTEINKLEDKLENYKPSFFQKIFNTTEKNKLKIKNEIKELELKTKREFDLKLKSYDDELSELKLKKDIANKVLEKDDDACIQVIEEMNPFSEISDLGTQLSFNMNDKKLVVNISVHSDSIIPSQIKTLLNSGKLSTKNMPKGVYNELYQDYVCSVILRISREVFSLLPLNEVIINAKDNMLNSSTGYKELETILSVLIVRSTLNSLNLDYIDPSDSMSNFNHNMNFKKTTGFKAVDDL